MAATKLLRICDNTWLDPNLVGFVAANNRVVNLQVGASVIGVNFPSNDEALKAAQLFAHHINANQGVAPEVE